MDSGRFCRGGLLLLVLAGVVPAGLTETSPVHPIYIQTDREIQTVQQLDQQVDALQVKIEQCIAAGLAPASHCHCYYPERLSQIRQTYDDVLTRYPDWSRRAVLWWDEGTPANIHFGNLRNKIEQPCEGIAASNSPFFLHVDS